MTLFVLSPLQELLVIGIQCLRSARRGESFAISVYRVPYAHIYIYMLFVELLHRPSIYMHVCSSLIMHITCVGLYVGFFFAISLCRVPCACVEVLHKALPLYLGIVPCLIANSFSSSTVRLHSTFFPQSRF